MIKTRKQLIQAYIEFFKSKGHKQIPNVSLIPEHDPTVLFTTAGMHPLVPFLLGHPHPLGKRLVNVQKCIRTGDIDKVGDDWHLTFFEMLGNWSLGDYWKKEAIEWSYEFLTRVLKLKKEKITITCFKGDKDAEKDTESAEIWRNFGIKKIKFLRKEENWWGPAGKYGPCGPDTEMFYNVRKILSNSDFSEHPETPTKKQKGFLDKAEIWNDVFMQYNKTEKGYLPLKQKNVDTGMGVERTIAILQGKKSVYETEVFLPIINKIKKLAGIDKLNKQQEKSIRIIADHIKAAVFILAENIQPSNIERGYVLRRLIRKAIRHGRLLDIKENFTTAVAEEVIKIYPDYNLKQKQSFIMEELKKEEEKFMLTLEKGLKRFEKMQEKTISGKDAFLLFQSYGFPLEMTIELAKEKGKKVDVKGYEQELKKHQELSRTATQGMFKSGLADHSEQVKKLHTATHLLLAALRQILNKNIIQKGSNITAERLRLDFNFDRKFTTEELKKVESLVNEKIQEKIPVEREEMTVEEAKKSGALGVFEQKYGERVFVYSIGDFSKEICAGPHVKNTTELGKFKIIKEESVAAGVRRIKAVLE